MKIGDSDDPLPDGWTVKVKKRPSGKGDKCYFPPSGEGKFNSKLEVVRYLNDNTAKSEKKNGINQDSTQNVALENSKPEVEGLPPGWTKEIKVTKKKGRKIRRDAYYTDPISGYLFRSMKDALRYVETGELGRLAIKPKDESNNNLELEDDESPAVAKKQKLEVNRTRSSNTSDQSSELYMVANDQNVFSPAGTSKVANSEVANDRHVLSPTCAGEVANDKHVVNPAGTGEVANDKHVLNPAGRGESTPVYEHTSGEKGSQSNDSGVQGNKSSMRKVRRNDPDKGLVATAGGSLKNEHSLDSDTNKDESIRTSLGKSKKKKDLSLPRRTSTRLSGLPLDPTSELKTTNRAPRAAVKESNGKASTNTGSSHSEFEGKNVFDTSKSTKSSLKSKKSKHPIVNFAAVGKVETKNMANRKPECASISLSGNQVETEKQSNEKLENAAISDDAGQIQIDNVDDEKSGLYLDLQLGDLCQDPCIAFAIKTLTGISFDNTDTIQVSTGSNSDLGGLATSEDQTRKEDAQFGLRTQQGCKADQPLNNLINCEQVKELETSNKNDLSFADVWADPCIEFAIKTLTGATPLNRGVVLQDCSQHKASSSQSQENSDMSLQNVAEISQSQIFRQQFGVSEGASYNQGSLMDPGLRHNKNMNVGYSDGSFRARHSQQISKGSQR